MVIQNKSRWTTSVLCVSIVSVALTLILLISSSNTTSAKQTTTYQGISSQNKCHEGGWTTHLPFDAPDIALTRPEYAEVTPGNPIRNITGTVVETLISHEDVPWTHTSHDSNWLVKLDSNYTNLNSHGNRNYDGSKPADNDPVDKKIMEMEWEIGTQNDGRDDRFPKEFWPSVGDRVWMEGRYIFDCGHPDTGPRSELHPATAVAFTHFEPLITGSPGSEPVLAAKTSIYIHGKGGPIYETPVGGRIYEFDVVLPPKPSPSSRVVNVTNTPFGGPPPSITGPFPGPGPTDNHVHVKYDLRTVSASPNNRFGSHITAGWIDPPQSNVYHYLTVTFDSVTKTAAKTPRGLGTISARLYGSHIWDNLWANVNGQYVQLLNPSNGFKKYTDPDKKILTPAPSVNTIVAEHGLGSTLNISTTGWIRSTAHNDNCFGEFDTIDLSTLNDLRRAVQCAESNTKAESLGRVDQTFSLGNDFERKVTSGPHTGVCSETNHIFGNVTCEFTLDFTVKDGGLINVSAPTTPTRPVNHAPVALDQHVTTEANKQVQVALGATDIDLDDSLSAAIVTPPHPDHGSVGQIDQNTGKVTYTPAPGFSGNDSFAFKVTDSHQAGSNVATVSITILPSPKPSPIPTPTVTCDPKSKTIQNGAKGAKVIELQTDLTALGYGELLGKHGPKQVGIDGIFGDDTKKAVIKFQQDNHLKKIDGIVGPETWGAILRLVITCETEQ